MGFFKDGKMPFEVVIIILKTLDMEPFCNEENKTNLISYGHRKPNRVYNRTSHALTDIHKSLPNLPSITKAATYLPTYQRTNHHQGCYIDGVGWKREGRGREWRFFFQCNKRWKLEDLKQLQQVGTSDPLESITQFGIANLQSFGENENLKA
jgi:hypothetical protein